MKGGRSRAETKKTTDAKLSVKKGRATKTKAVKDPNMPKRPASAFFVFMEDFRKQYKEKHPNNKSVAAVGKAGGNEWKSMSEADKAPYVSKAEKRKAEYEKNLQAYNKKKDAAEDESDKSKSEIDEDDDEGSDGEEEDDDE